MTMRESQPSARPVMLRADLRPYRVALLVSPEVPGSVERAFRAASSVWGGWRCPLVPVSADGSIKGADRERVGLLNCDGLYNFTVGEDGMPRWPSPRLGLDVRYVDGARGWWPASPMMFSDSYSGWEGGQVEVAVPLPRPELLAAEVAGVPRLWALAALGGVWDAEDLAALGRHGVVVGPPADPADLVLAQLSQRSLISATMHHDVDEDVQLGSGGTLGSAVVVTVMPALQGSGEVDFGDAAQDGSGAIAWWNARAMRPVRGDELSSRSVLLPVPAIDDDRVVEALRQAVHDVDCAPALFLTAGPGASPEASPSSASGLISQPSPAPTPTRSGYPSLAWPRVVKTRRHGGRCRESSGRARPCRLSLRRTAPQSGTSPRPLSCRPCRVRS